jgi:uncharacterized membrane protein
MVSVAGVATCGSGRYSERSAIELIGYPTLFTASPRHSSAFMEPREAPVTLGPLEYTVIGFEGNRFNGEIAREIEKVVEKRIIRLVDVVFVTKDIDGEVSVVEIDNKDDRRFAGFAPMMSDLMGLLTPEDILQLAAELPTNTSALILLFEHRWAEKVKDAIQGAGGFLISRTTVAPEVLELVNAELEGAAV